MNTQWHAEHRLARTAGFDERVQWHIAHAEACGCRPIPPDIAEAIDAERTMAPD